MSNEDVQKMHKLSEEEKEAIKDLKGYLEWVKDRRTHSDKITEIVLNLIDRLQIQVEESEKALVREREFKNKEIDRLQKELDNSISKDKIKDKIEHYKKELEKIEKGEEFADEKNFYEYGIFFLEDLLKENQ